MNRGNVVLIIVIVLIVGFLAFLSNKFKGDSDRRLWQFNYQYGGEELPYDRDFCLDYLKKDVGSSNFYPLEERFSKTDNKKPNSLYLFYNRQFDIDKTETQALYDFVAEGNDALIIADNFNFEFFKELRGIQLSQEEPYLALSRYDSAVVLSDIFQLNRQHNTPVSIYTYGHNALSRSFKVDTNNIDVDVYGLSTTYTWEANEDEYEEEEYEVEEEAYLYEEEEVLEETVITKSDQSYGKSYPNPEIRILGTSENLGPNLLKIAFGKGHILLHSNPVLFTNVQLDKPEIFQYTQAMFDELTYEHIYFDELRFQFLNAQAEGKTITDQSYFEYIFSNRALKTAFYFFLIGLLVFLVVGIKRRCNAIEIVDPITNSSIDFSKTIARLYWLNPNHRKMADQKMKMFLFEVRNRYGLTTHELDEEFQIRFGAKSGVSEKLINRLFDAYNLARQSPTIHSDVLIQISESIVKIRQEWK